MTGVTIIAGATKMLSQIGVGTIVGSACKAFTPAEATVLRKVCCGVGTFAITGAVGMKANAYIDETVEACAELVKEVKKSKKVKEVKQKCKEKKEERKVKKAVKALENNLIELGEKKEQFEKKIKEIAEED